MKSKKIIYALRCPITNEIHYIGKSTKGFIRPLQHIIESHSLKINEWVNDLKLIGQIPKVEILHYVEDCDDLDFKERYYIQISLDRGDLLLNDKLVTPIVLKPISYDTEPIDTIGMFIKQKRKSLQMTQEDLSKKSGVGLRLIREVEQGHKKTNQMDKVNKVLKLFGRKLGVVNAIKEE